MAFKVQGKVALVTGGASGLGFSIARVLLEKNAKGVAILDVDEIKGKETENQFNEEFGYVVCIFIKTDVSEETQMKAAFDLTVETFQQLDIVINNAGILNDFDWKKNICTNLGGCISGTILAIDTYLPKYKKGEEGIIINIGSIASVVPMGFCPVYSAAKHGIVALSRCFGQQEHYERCQVRVIAVCPGYMATALVSQPISRNPEYLKVFTRTIGDNPCLEPEVAAERLVDIMKNSPNGSVWILEGDQRPYQVVFPNFRKNVTVKM